MTASLISIIGLSSALMASATVEVSSCNWSNIPLLFKPASVRLSDNAMETIDQLVAGGKCNAIGNRKRINLDMDFLVQFGKNDAIKRVIVEKIGCPEVEQIVATATAQAADKGWLKPTGENDAGWYRGAITYRLQ